jgi:hypothetical protein
MPDWGALVSTFVANAAEGYAQTDAKRVFEERKRITDATADIIKNAVVTGNVDGLQGLEKTISTLFGKNAYAGFFESASGVQKASAAKQQRQQENMKAILGMFAEGGDTGDISGRVPEMPAPTAPASPPPLKKPNAALPAPGAALSPQSLQRLVQGPALEQGAPTAPQVAPQAVAPPPPVQPDLPEPKADTSVYMPSPGPQAQAQAQAAPTLEGRFPTPAVPGPPAPPMSPGLPAEAPTAPEAAPAPVPQAQAPASAPAPVADTSTVRGFLVSQAARVRGLPKGVSMTIPMGEGLGSVTISGQDTAAQKSSKIFQAVTRATNAGYDVPPDVLAEALDTAGADFPKERFEAYANRYAQRYGAQVEATLAARGLTGPDLDRAVARETLRATGHVTAQQAKWLDFSDEEKQQMVAGRIQRAADAGVPPLVALGQERRLNRMLRPEWERAILSSFYASTLAAMQRQTPNADPRALIPLAGAATGFVGMPPEHFALVVKEAQLDPDTIKQLAKEGKLPKLQSTMLLDAMQQQPARRPGEFQEGIAVPVPKGVADTAQAQGVGTAPPKKADDLRSSIEAGEANVVTQAGRKAGEIEQAQQNVERRIDQGTEKDLSLIQNTLSSIQRVRQLYKPEYVGLSKGVLTAGAERLGGLTAEESAFRAAVNRIIREDINAFAGRTVTGIESGFAKAPLPELTVPADAFMARLNEMELALRRGESTIQRRGREQRLRSSEPVSGSGPASPSTGGRPSAAERFKELTGSDAERYQQLIKEGYRR